MSDRAIDCPRCGRAVSVPTTGQKVWCSGCGQKFRCDPEAEPEHPASQPSPLDKPVDEPLSEPSSEPADEAPEEPQAEAEDDWQPPPPPDRVMPQPAELRCIQCGKMVLVPTNGTPVNCEGCGQEYKLDLTGASTNAPTQPPPLQTPEPGDRPAAAPVKPPPLQAAGPDESVETDEVKAIDCPRCAHKVIVPVTGAKVRCPGCRQKFRFDPETFGQMSGSTQPPPLEVEEPPATPGELRKLWPSVCLLVSRCYEDALVDDVARVEFRDQANRAATLARELLRPPVGAGSSGYTLLTGVLAGTTLDEIIRLSIADYRQLQESLEGAQRLIDTQLTEEPAQGLPSIISALPPSGPPAQPQAAPQSNVGFYVGLAAIAVTLIVAIFIVPRILETMRQDQEAQGMATGDMPWSDIDKKGPPAPGVEPVVIVKKNGKGTPLEPTAIPVFDPKKPAPVPPVAKKGDDTPVVKPGARYMSRWKPGPDGWITVFNGVDLDGLLGDGAQWTVQNGNTLQGSLPGSATSIGVSEAAWTHFQIGFDAMLGKQGSFTVRQGGLTIAFTDKTVYANARGNADPIATVGKGLTRGKWYTIAIDLDGPNLEVSVNGTQALASAARPETRHNPLLEVLDGAVRFRNVALRLHENDPDYAAVVLGEGYANKPQAPVAVAPDAPVKVAGLPLGEHTLFDGASLKGWERTGGSTVMDGSMLLRAPMGQLGTAMIGNLDWRDVVFQAQARLTRPGRMPRNGEYFLIMFRGQDDANFLCIRFALEGIYEIGYYRNGRWTETGRARYGLGTDFNKWHDIQIKVQAKKLDIVIDGNSTGPTLPIAYWGKGLVGLGVTGGEAVFRSVRVRALR